MPNDDWTTKHIFVGETRVVSKVGIVTEDIPYEQQNTYFYHGDHLGSSNYVTDPDGRVYEQIEYTPWGEVWVDHASANLAAGDSLGKVDWTFTSKEYDPETGLYSFPARYYEPQTSRWMSVDPAVPDYLPERPVDEAARRRNQNLPGMGGVFNPVNLNVYHYSANNPIMNVDPSGTETIRIGAKASLTNPLSFVANIWNSVNKAVNGWGGDPVPSTTNTTVGLYLNTETLELGFYNNVTRSRSTPAISLGVESGYSELSAKELFGSPSASLSAEYSAAVASYSPGISLDNNNRVVESFASAEVGLIKLKAGASAGQTTSSYMPLFQLRPINDDE